MENTQICLCLCSGSSIMTEKGEIEIEKLKVNDTITVSDGRNVEIQSIIYHKYENPEGQFKPYMIPKGYIGENMPNKDLYISGSHLFKDVNGSWTCSHVRQDIKQVDVDFVEYYNFKLGNYYTDFPVANGMIVDTEHTKENSIFFINDGKIIVSLDDLNDEQRNFIFR